MNCSFCGLNIQVRSAYCPSCGSPITDEALKPAVTGPNRLALSSLQQASTKQAVNTASTHPLSPGKLSDYKPGGSQESKPLPTPAPSNTPMAGPALIPGIGPGTKLSHYSQPYAQPAKLSDYKQPSLQPSKLSDYKQPPLQPSKLSDYKQRVDQSSTPANLPNYQALSSTPKAEPGPFNTTSTTPFSPPAPSSTPLTTPAIVNPPGPFPPSFSSQMAHAEPMTSSAQTANPSGSPSFIPAGGGYIPHPAFSPGDSSTQHQGKRRSLFIAGIAITLLITCIGAAALLFLQRTDNKPPHRVIVTRQAVTPLPTVPIIHGPSGNTSVPAISALFNEPQMTTNINSGDQAVKTTNAFTSGQTIYVTFTLNSKGQKGYVQARWYKGKQLFHEVSFAHEPGRTNGYFSMVYDTPTPDGSVELYWSTTPNFSDAKLARTAHFTVTG